MLRILQTVAILHLAGYVDNKMHTTANSTVSPVSEFRNMSRETIILGPNELTPSNFKCYHGGKTYKEGEIWASGHLRYKCGKFGAYNVLGCRTKQNRSLNVGETYINDSIAYQCFKHGSTTYYRESPCDLVGQPSCESIRKNPPGIPAKIVPNDLNGMINQTNGLPAVAGLPQGWKIVDLNGNTIPLTRVKVISSSSTSPMHSTHTFMIQRKTKREAREVVGTLTEIPIDEEMIRERVVGIGTGSVSLDSRKPTVSLDRQKMKPGTVTGVRSQVTWNGKAAMINGKRIAMGPGTFTFGNAPTGSFFHKIN